jgi:hypothetical protein
MKKGQLKGIDALNKMPPLFGKLYVKNLEKQRISVYDALYRSRFIDVPQFVNQISWRETNEGSEFWEQVYQKNSKEAFRIFKNNKNKTT